MDRKQQPFNTLSHTVPRPTTVVLAMAIAFALTLVATSAAQTQTFSILHVFTGGPDGAIPAADLIMDGVGNFYGTTRDGGGAGAGYGTVYKLTRNGSSWVYSSLYKFAGGSDGANPWAGITIGPHGVLYGTTSGGGSCSSCGTVFKLTPPPNASSASWIKTVLYRFNGNDGRLPAGDLVFDQEGNLYGATAAGGSNYEGNVYELRPSRGGWTESILYQFLGYDGNYSRGGVIFDGAGNLYGTTETGGTGGIYGYGTVFQLTPSYGGWTENVLYNFQNTNDGLYPNSGLVFDRSGNLYGTTPYGGSGGGGTVFELSPSSGGWIYTTLYSFTGLGGPNNCRLIVDATGSLYGTTISDGAYGWGSVFKLAPSSGGWVYSDIYDFSGDGNLGEPIAGVTLDALGNLYGTTATGGGVYNYGVVWEITP